MPKQLFIALVLVSLVCWINACQPTPPANYNAQLKNIPDTIRYMGCKRRPRQHRLVARYKNNRLYHRLVDEQRRGCRR
jgi:hypothetical protein